MDEQPLAPLAKSLHMLGDLSRLRILVLLLHSKRAPYVNLIVSETGISHSTVVHHLTKLEEHGLVSKFTSGRFTHYVPVYEEVERLIDQVNTLLKGVS